MKTFENFKNKLEALRLMEKEKKEKGRESLLQDIYTWLGKFDSKFTDEYCEVGVWLLKDDKDFIALLCPLQFNKDLPCIGLDMIYKFIPRVAYNAVVEAVRSSEIGRVVQRRVE